jgi:urea transport system permease protein
MTEAAVPEPGARNPAGEAVSPAYPVRPPAVTTTFTVNPQSALSRRLGWLGIALFIALLFTPGVALADDKYWLPLFTRYMALALFAVSLDLVWGYTGLLSLGHGLYFGMGAYIVGYSLKLQKAALEAGKPFTPGPNMALPDFMAYCRLDAVPGWIAPLINIYVALPLAVLLPTVAAAAFGYITFRRRIKGVYFALITQALVLAAFTFVVNQQPYTGGVVGMNNLAKLELFGQRFHGLSLFYLTTAVLAVAFLACLGLVRSKFGKILTAIRDSEYRVLALGYDTAAYKTFIFALAGGLAGLAGALYVADLGTTGPDTLSIVFSIQVVVLVAVGGRGTLLGAVLGAVLVSFAETYINDNYNEVFRKYLHGEGWPLLMGGLFVLVVVFLPEGLVGGFNKGIARLKQITLGRLRQPGGGRA